MPVALVLAVLGAAPQGASPVSFTEVAADAGLRHAHGDPAQPLPGFERPFMSGGAAAGDFDGDGWADLYFTRVGDDDLLYRNLGVDAEGAHLGFEDVSASALPNPQPWTHTNGVAWGDIDGDGDLDLYVTTLFWSRYLLFVNDGAGHFTEEALERGASIESGFPHHGFSPAFGDFDRDGHLDLAVAEWGFQFPNRSHARLLRNRGRAAPGHFEDVTLAAGVSIDDSVATGPTGDFPGVFAFSPRFGDLDGDGWPDLTMANDFATSRLFWNEGDGTFSDGTLGAGVATDENGMGSTLGDFDGDGRLDWFVTSIYDPLALCAQGGCNWGTTGNRLYRNDGGRAFVDATDAAGVRDGGWGWGASFLDFDCDGLLDLAMTNGIDFPFTQIDAPFENDPVRLWHNRGGSFAEVSASARMVDRGSGKGLVVLDFDRDGDPDVLIVNNLARPRLYRNEGAADNGWLRVALRGSRSNSHGIGARVELQATPGGPWQVRELDGGSNYLSQNEPVAQFGLGPGTHPVARLRIRWPSGIVQELRDVERDAEHVVQEPAVKARSRNARRR